MRRCFALIVGMLIIMFSSLPAKAPTWPKIPVVRDWSTDFIQTGYYMESVYSTAPDLGFTDKLDTPIGHRMYCQYYPVDCTAHEGKITLLTAKRKLQLLMVNRHVNHSVRYEVDTITYSHYVIKHYLEDFWSYPTSGYGDCEDYALEKRSILERLGWPISSLLLVMGTQNGAGHAVLLVRTSEGDFVLNNQEDAIISWKHAWFDIDTIRRQSASNSSKWVWTE